VVKVLSDVLSETVHYIISDNGKQFIAKAFEEFCESSGIVHVRITPYRAQTNGIAERLVRTIKEMLRLREWRSNEEIEEILIEVQVEYNERPNQAISGLSPVEYKRRLEEIPVIPQQNVSTVRHLCSHYRGGALIICGLQVVFMDPSGKDGR
jgi:transposase InsO family protein